MRLRLERPIVFFDVETTGLDPSTDRIIELAAVKIWPDGRREEKCRRFNPGMPIPKEATAIHGIRDEDVRDEPPFSRLARGIAAFFSDCDLGGYNIADYDVPILSAELERAGHKLDLSTVSLVDAYKIFVHEEPRHLSAAVRFYCGRDHEAAHSAMGDVKATIDVLEAELERYASLPDTPSALESHVRDPEHVDRRGRLRWQDGEIAVAFGKHKGRTLKWLAVNEPDYIHWMIESNVAPDAEKILRDALLPPFDDRARKS